MSNIADRLPSRLTVVVGTYDGVVAGWDTERAPEQEEDDVDLRLMRRNDGRHLKLSFATSAHQASVRCVDMAGATGGPPRQRPPEDEGAAPSPAPAPGPGTLVSGGHDDSLNIFDLRKRRQAGELRTPSDLGSPLCCAFAPPASGAPSASAGPPTHVLVGTSSGKVVLYRRRDWSVQHVLAGHDDGGVRCLAVHPTGRMALTGGRDGKIVLWDLTRGRLAYVHKLPKGRRGPEVNHILWSADGARWAYCRGAQVAAHDVAGGAALLDVALPSRVNQVAFVGGPEGMFLAAACDNGGLPVLEVGQLTDEGGEEAARTRRALMAIEPVDRVVAGDDRLKCIRAVEGGSGFLIVTANSGGVVSLMDLEGAARMMLMGEDGGDSDGKDSGDGPSGDTDSDADSDDDSDDEIEAAVEILDSVRLGSGARITDLAVWSCGSPEDEADLGGDAPETEAEGVPPLASDDDEKKDAAVADEVPAPAQKKRGRKESQHATHDIELDAAAMEKARKLVGQAKKRQKKEKKRLAKQT